MLSNFGRRSSASSLLRKSLWSSAPKRFTNTESHDSHEECEGYRVPRKATAVAQPRKFRECPNDILYVMSINGEYGARRERLVRDVMKVDEITWAEARDKVDGEINSANDNSSWLVRLPYQIGVFGGFLGSVSSVPLVFHRGTAEWFAENFVNEDAPDGGIESLDTFWKVGNWTWGWMEPYLGTASFVLLGLQFTRINMQRLHWKPYTEKILQMRANRLVNQYPQYNEDIVREFSESDPWD